MYTQLITRRRRGCIMFLLDRSDSMKRQWGAAAETLAEGAARAINEILMELCLRSQVEPGKVRDYFDIGIFGYGIRPIAGGEGVESAFFDEFRRELPLVSLPVLKAKPTAMLEVPSTDTGAPPSKIPVWVRPVHGRQTPMCQAISVAGEQVYGWAEAHPDSFPPVIINITDGLVTDNPYLGASLGDWADRLTSIRTTDGHALLFNIFLSPTPGGEVLFPATPRNLPPPGPDLFRISSELALPLLQKARQEGADVSPGARGFAFNANFPMLVRFLRIGTGLRVQD